MVYICTNKKDVHIIPYKQNKSTSRHFKFLSRVVKHGPQGTPIRVPLLTGNPWGLREWWGKESVRQVRTKGIFALRDTQRSNTATEDPTTEPTASKIPELLLSHWVLADNGVAEQNILRDPPLVYDSLTLPSRHVRLNVRPSESRLRTPSATPLS